MADDLDLTWSNSFLSGRNPATLAAAVLTLNLPPAPIASPRPQQDDGVFHLFPLLPLEIRWVIWEFCLPNRVVELDFPYWGIGDPNHPRLCEFVTTSTTNSCPPVISRVCREARQVALRNGCNGGLPGPLDDNPSYYYYINPWIQPRRDILHLNWTPRSEPILDRALTNSNYFDVPEDRPIRLLRSLQERVHAPAISISANLIMPFSEKTRYVSSEHLEDAKVNWDLCCSNEFMVVLEVVTLHIRPDVATLSGLFGVAGDERIQLVDPDDWATMTEYLTLWRLQGSPVGADDDAVVFFAAMPDLRARVAEWRREVGKLSIWRREPNGENPRVRQARQEMPELHPRIMFRLCGGECHRSPSHRPRLRWASPRPNPRPRREGLWGRPPTDFTRNGSPPWPPQRT
ncbi:hypothetical protein QBC39DRAFT_36302 [Podospora conica]|nr:hypothetical protein QBC39DRAFT_36302 [Schizothecium conicum]